MALAIIVLVLLGSLTFFYLKCSMMQAVATLWSAIFAMILTFSYYEPVAELFISRGYGLQWAHCGCFIIIFIITFAVFRSISEFLVGAKIDIGTPIKISMVMGCGVFTGIIVAGMLLVAIGLLPKQGTIFYTRFDPEKPVVLNRPAKPALNADGFTSGLFSWISSGAMSSSKSFGVLHADYLSQIHLNKLKIDDDISSVCSRDALVLPSGKVKKPVRLWDLPETGEVTVIRAGIVSRKIESGGANNPSGGLSFFPAQFRLISKTAAIAGANNKPMTGTATAIYPKGIINDGQFVQMVPGDIIEADTKKMVKGVYWVDFVFDVPPENTPVLLQFRQNAMVDLSSYNAVKTSPEIENTLDSTDEEKDKAA